MYIALDLNNNRVWADEAVKDAEYFCPICGERLILKRGSYKTIHFAHHPNSNCIGFKNDMSPWHKRWQEQFPIEWREVILQDENVIHIADICDINKKIIIEFQHSYISNEDFCDRSIFYNKLGYKVIWIFDYSEELFDECFEEKRKSYYWKTKRREAISNFDFYCQKNISIFLQFHKSPWDLYDDYINECSTDYIGNGELYEIKWIGYYENKLYVTFDEFIKSPINFLRDYCDEITLAKAIIEEEKYYKALKEERKKHLGDYLYDKFLEGDYYILCPIKNRIVRIIESCNQFECDHMDKDGFCLGNLMANNIDLEEIDKYEKDGNDFLSKIYMKDGTSIRIKHPANELKTIQEIYDCIGEQCKMLRLYNVETDWFVTISKSPKLQLKQYKSVKGKFTKERYQKCGSELKEIFDYNQKRYILVWIP